MFLYPLAITLIVLALCGGWFGHDRRVYVSVTALTCAAAVFDLIKTLPEKVIAALNLEGVILFMHRFLPFYDINLGWVLPAAVGLGIGLALRAGAKRR